jgi:hypothetical protein
MSSKPMSFAPDTVATMRSALDAAVDQISESHRTPATKAKMAERILQTAADGVTDADELVSVAVEAGSQRAA